MPNHISLHKRNALKALTLGLLAILMATSAVFSMQQANDHGRAVYPSQVDVNTADADTATLQGEKTILPNANPEVRIPQSQLQHHGIYRLIPAGFAGVVDFDVIVPSWPAGTSTSLESELVKSPLYKEVREIPEGLSRIIFDSHDSTSGIVVRQVFRSDDGQHSIEVTRRAITRTPIDISVPGMDASIQMFPEMIGGKEAIIYRRAESSPNPNAFTFIQTHDGQIETIVVVKGMPEATAFKILEEVL